MKNSNKWLLATVLVLLGSLTAYNMALRTEYRKGTYKDPLREYSALNFSNFTQLEVPAASVVGVRVSRGPFSVRISSRATEFVHVRQQGGRLVVTAAFPEQWEYLGPTPVVISCPQLATLTTDAQHEVHGQLRVDKNGGYGNGPTVLVQGFAQDSLVLHQDKRSRIELAGNQLGSLRVVAGPTPGSHAVLQINSDNHIGRATLNMQHQSELLLNNIAIPRLRYAFADSAKATFTGAALGRLLKE